MCFNLCPLPLVLSVSTTDVPSSSFLPTWYSYVSVWSSPEPSLHHTEQFQISLPFLIGEVSQSLNHLGSLPLYPCLCGTGKPRTGHKTPDVASLVLSSGEGPPPPTCWAKVRLWATCDLEQRPSFETKQIKTKQEKTTKDNLVCLDTQELTPFLISTCSLLLPILLRQTGDLNCATDFLQTLTCFWGWAAQIVCSSYVTQIDMSMFSMYGSFVMCNT